MTDRQLDRIYALTSVLLVLIGLALLWWAGR